MQETTAHTLYAKHAKLRKLAIEKISNNRRYLFKDGLDKDELALKIKQNITPYLVDVVPNDSPLQEQIDALKNNPKQDAALQQKIQQKRDLLAQYGSAYHQAVIDYQQTSADMQALYNSNTTFLSLDEKRHEYLYIIDRETCQHLSLEQKKEKDAPQEFKNKTDIELTGNQTDAVRIWRNNISLHNLTIRDNRTDTETAHRDGIQLIPPPKYREIKDENGQTKLVKQADQMAGTVLENATISNCDILAPNAALQGIFSSDGMCKNLKIDSVKIGTRGGHAISIAGALTGCEMRNISLYQQPNGPMPEIGLFPVRIGGNMADDGMIYIFDFLDGSGYDYGEVISHHNKVYKTGQSQPEILNPTDHRATIPRRFIKISFGLRDFNYPKYFEEYTKWTIKDFKNKMPQQYQQMSAWIDRRFSEYSSGTRMAEPETVNGTAVKLPNISNEQKNRKEFGVWDMLQKARKALNTQDPEWLNTRLPELQETAIRSFTMKCIALDNGKADALYDLGEADNAMRKAYLHYLLDDNDFNNLTENPYANHTNEEETATPETVEIPAREVEKKLKDSGIKDAYQEAIDSRNWTEKARLQNIMVEFRQTRIWKQEYELKKENTDSTDSTTVEPVEIPAREVEKKLEDAGIKDAYQEAIEARNWIEKARLQEIMVEFRETRMWKQEYELQQENTGNSDSTTVEPVEIPAREVEKKLDDAGIKDAYQEAIEARNWTEKVRLQDIMVEFRETRLWKQEYELQQENTDSTDTTTVEPVEIPAREVEKKLDDAGIKDAYQEAINAKNWAEKTRLQDIMTEFRQTRMWKQEYELKQPSTNTNVQSQEGSINLIIKDIETGIKLTNEFYTLIQEEKPFNIYKGETGTDGSIKLKSIPSGNYQLFLNDYLIAISNTN